MKKQKERFEIIQAVPSLVRGPLARHWEPILVALKPGECIEYRGPRSDKAWHGIAKTIGIPLTTQRQLDGALRIWKLEGAPNIRARNQLDPRRVNRKS